MEKSKEVFLEVNAKYYYDLEYDKNIAESQVKELQKIIKEKDKEIKALKNKVERLEKKISEYSKRPKIDNKTKNK